MKLLAKKTNKNKFIIPPFCCIPPNKNKNRERRRSIETIGIFILFY